jgi:hypothetical protein
MKKPSIRGPEVDCLLGRNIHHECSGSTNFRNVSGLVRDCITFLTVMVIVDDERTVSPKRFSSSYVVKNERYKVPLQDTPRRKRNVYLKFKYGQT